MVLPAGFGAFFSVFYNVNQTKLLAEAATNCPESTEEETEVNESVTEDKKITKLKVFHQIAYYKDLHWSTQKAFSSHGNSQYL